MPYRDDRSALRQKNVELERELESARAELARLRGEPGSAIQVAAPSAVRMRPARRGDRAIVVAFVVLLASAAGAALSSVGWVVAPLWIWIAASAVLGGLLARSPVIAGPHEAVVLTGRTYRRADGSRVGHRIVHNARVFRALGERAERLDLGLFALEVLVRRAETKDGSLFDVGLGACARIDPDPPGPERAVERFLGRDATVLRDQVRGVVVDGARRTLGATRAADLSTHPKSVRHAIQAEVSGELASLGLELFVLELLGFEAPIKKEERSDDRAKRARGAGGLGRSIKKEEP